jgi:DNA-directed RNA polymerase specialized sigma24 family protein
MRTANDTGPPARAAGGPAPAASPAEAFERFVRDAEPRLRRALVAVYGFEEGRDAAAEALAYAWEHWARLQDVSNLPGYLYRVAQSHSRVRCVPRVPRATAVFDGPGGAEHRFEPGLPSALAALSQRQRVAVVLIHGYGCTLREVSELIGVKPTTVQNHLERGLARLRTILGVSDEH